MGLLYHIHGLMDHKVRPASTFPSAPLTPLEDHREMLLAFRRKADAAGLLLLGLGLVLGCFAVQGFSTLNSEVAVAALGVYCSGCK